MSLYLPIDMHNNHYLLSFLNNCCVVAYFHIRSRESCVNFAFIITVTMQCNVSKFREDRARQGRRVTGPMVGTYTDVQYVCMYVHLHIHT